MIDQCRDVRELNVLVSTMLSLAIADIRKQGVQPLIVETYRTQERQNYLYCQGRTIADVTVKNISTQFATAYCAPRANKVTWTLNSVHVSRKAIDVVPVRGGVAIWNAQDPQTRIIIKTMQKYGFEAGANWSKVPDSPHFQVKANFTNVFDRNHTTINVTKAIQKALGIKADGAWGDKTDAEINKWRATKKWKQTSAIGATALKKLLTDL